MSLHLTSQKLANLQAALSSDVTEDEEADLDEDIFWSWELISFWVAETDFSLKSSTADRVGVIKTRVGKAYTKQTSFAWLCCFQN